MECLTDHLVQFMLSLVKKISSSYLNCLSFESEGFQARIDLTQINLPSPFDACLPVGRGEGEPCTT
jgi:hypothetical protein